MKKLKIKIFYILLLVFMISFPITSFAHSGRTDSRGGHHDYKNKSGLGSYHYHHGMGPHLHPGGVCPYGYGSSGSKSSSTPSPSIKIINYPETLNVGESSGFEYSVSNATSNDTSVTSSNTDVVKINNNNTLKAVGAGTATITIEASGTTKTFTVKVTTVPVEEVIISNVIDRIQLGEEYKFEASVLPKNATNKNITWSSDNTDILNINESGNIETIAAGIVTITALADNNIESKVTIEVYEIVPESIDCNDSINLVVGEKKNYEINILPDNSNNKDFEVSCDNENILRYSDSSVEAVSEGETILHIKTWNGIIRNIPVTVNIIPVESVNIVDSTEYLMSNIIDKNSDIILDTEILPNNATYQNVDWTSSDNNIITVNNNSFNITGTGKVTLTCNTHENITSSITFFVINKNFIFLISFPGMAFIALIVTMTIKRKDSFNGKEISNNYVNNNHSQSDIKKNNVNHIEQNNPNISHSLDKVTEQDKKDIVDNINKDLRTIKNMIFKEAKAGNYKIVDNKKCIVIIYPCEFLLQCVNKKNTQPSEYGIADNYEITYYIEMVEKYNLYIHTIKKHVAKHGLSIYPFFVVVDDSNHKEIVKLPYIYKDDVNTHQIKAYLKCTIKY